MAEAEEPPLILVADDVPANVELLFDQLQTLGYRTIAATDGPSAVARCFEAMPELCILDVAMPGMSGPDLQEELTQRCQKIPIVFISAHGDRTVRPRLVARGAVDCLFKPFSEAALLDALNAALRMR